MAVFTLCRQKRKVPAGRMVITESQMVTIPSGVKKVDLFLVGGGGAGGRNMTYTQTGPDYYTERFIGRGGAGGGGYTATFFNVSVTPNEQIEAIIGAGGSRRYNPGVSGNDGGTTYFGEYYALGGKGGGGGHASDGYVSSGAGGDGGSGGGAGGYYYSVTIYEETSTHLSEPNGTSGIDGGDGADVPSRQTSGCRGYGDKGGKGQGTTTREFGETNGTLYSSAGVNTSSYPSNNNTGNGGRSEHGAGDSGIIIVRWKAQ